ncbi:MAG: MBL fold metallo-hydrolase [Prevotella sp.]
MLKFISFGSGSSGNCCFLYTQTEGLMIDAGIGIRLIKKYFREYGLSLPVMKQILVTHDHADHVKAVGYLSEHLHVPVYATKAVHAGIERNYCVHRKVPLAYRQHIVAGETYEMGAFKVTPFAVPHDSLENLGYYIQVEDAAFCFITDAGSVTEEMKGYISKADYLVIESNYDDQMLQAGRYPEYLKTRIAGKNGHLSNQECVQVVMEHKSEHLRKIWLCHLSEENNHPDLALKTMELSLKQQAEGTVPEVYVLKRKVPTGIFELK